MTDRFHGHARDMHLLLSILFPFFSFFDMTPLDFPATGIGQVLVW